MALADTLGNLALLAFITADAGAIYQALASVLDRRNWPPPGRLIDMGGHRLHIQVAGQGGPTVVFEAGGGSWSIEWFRVLPEVAKFTCAVAYDRSGYGWSDISLKNASSRSVAEELHALLEAAGIEGPYILVGRSTGALHVRMFAHLYPQEVAGMVLLDAAHEEEKTRILPALREVGERELQLLGVLRLLAPLGLIRFLGWWGALARLRILEKLPSEKQQQVLAGIYRSLYCNTLYGEYQQFDESAGQVRATGSLGDLPLAVVTAGDHLDAANYPKDFPIAQAQQIWEQLQSELATLSANSRHEVLEGCSTYLPMDCPAAVVDAIRWVYDRTCGQPGR